MDEIIDMIVEDINMDLAAGDIRIADAAEARGVATGYVARYMADFGRWNRFDGRSVFLVGKTEFACKQEAVDKVLGAVVARLAKGVL